jgi:signal transduction histidine kinase/CheY-like chemotaxis protein
MQIKTLNNKKILAEQARALHQQAVSSQLGGLFISTILVVVFWPLVPTQYLLVWFICLNFVSIGRFFITHRCDKKSSNDDVIISWLYKMFILLALSGCIWGVGAYVFFIPGQIETESLLIVFYIALIAGSLSPLSSFLPCYLVYVIPASLPLGLQLLFSDPRYFSYAIPVGFLGFLVINCLYARNIQSNTLRMIGLRFENFSLLAQVTQSQKLALEQADLARQANLSKSKFLIATTHDLAQPLNSLVLFLAALRKANDKAEGEELLVKAHQCADNLKALFTVLQDFSQLDSTIKISTEQFDIASLINPIAVEFELKAAVLHRGFEVDVHSHNVDTDGVLLQRIIRNLLDNALKHNQSGKIGVRTGQYADKVIVEVFDTGQGIPADKLDSIFDEYVQLDNQNRDKRVGLGLGLAIVAKVAGLLDANIDVKSTVGQGTVFSITLPMTKETQNYSSTLDDVTPASGSLVGHLVVIIDDNESIRDAMQAVMMDWGCDVVAVVDGSHLVEILSGETRVPSIIVSDYRLADGKNGYGEIALLREEFNRAIPAIIVTGDVSTVREISSLHRSIPVLHKPLDEKVLREIIVDLLSGQA